MSGTIENVKIDRPHRYRVGSLVRHVDTPSTRENIAVVTELTYTVRDGVAYPTYTLSPYHDENIVGVLCTADLVGAYES